jgi:acetoacetyl-CoA synthetase
MIARRPFPSVPACFWGDPDTKLYRESYFERFSHVDVWAQHDWMCFNPETGGSAMHGRGDGALNPSSIRFGSGEIYAIVEGPAFNAEIAERLCVGRRRPSDTDESVFLFVHGRGTRIHRRRGEETAEGDQPGVECETCAEGYCGS